MKVVYITCRHFVKYRKKIKTAHNLNTYKEALNILETSVIIFAISFALAGGFAFFFLLSQKRGRIACSCGWCLNRNGDKPLLTSKESAKCYRNRIKQW